MTPCPSNCSRRSFQLSPGKEPLGRLTFENVLRFSKCDRVCILCDLRVVYDPEIWFLKISASWLTDVQMLRVLKDSFTLNPPFGCSYTFISLAGGRLICSAGGHHYADMFLAYRNVGRSAQRNMEVRLVISVNLLMSFIWQPQQAASKHHPSHQLERCSLETSQKAATDAAHWITLTKFRFKSSCAADASAGWRGMVSQMCRQRCAKKIDSNWKNCGKVS